MKVTSVKPQEKKLLVDVLYGDCFRLLNGNHHYIKVKECEYVENLRKVFNLDSKTYTCCLGLEIGELFFLYVNECVDQVFKEIHLS